MQNGALRDPPKPPRPHSHKAHQEGGALGPAKSLATRIQRDPVGPSVQAASLQSKATLAPIHTVFVPTILLISKNSLCFYYLLSGINKILIQRNLDWSSLFLVLSDSLGHQSTVGNLST